MAPTAQTPNAPPWKGGAGRVRRRRPTLRVRKRSRCARLPTPGPSLAGRGCEKLERLAGDPGDLAGDESLDHVGEMAVEPVLEHRPQHLADRRAQRIVVRRKRVAGRLAKTG